MVWALTVSLGLGLRRPDFPGSLKGQRIVMGITTVLVAGTLAAAVLTSSPPSQHALVTKNTRVELAGAPLPTQPAVGVTSTTTTAPPPSAVKISTATLPKLGPVLVNAEGHTLYIFEPDKHVKVTCVSACALVWPPAKLASAQKAVAAGETKAALLASDADPEGGSVVTYAGWPLYTFAGDSAAGTASGQHLNANGGLWYVISPAGKVIETAP